MDENKIRSDAENAAEGVTEERKTEEAQAEPETVNEEPVKAEKPEKMRNQAILRRGSFSIAITAAVLAGIIVLNILTGALSKRVSLDFDMTPEKKNSFTAENTEFLKKIKKKVTITVCAAKEDYASQIYSNLYSYYGEYLVNPTEYLEQTITLLDRYPVCNRNITLKYLDTQSTEIMSILDKYKNEDLTYGSIIVSANEGDDEVYKVLNFEDIYQHSDDYYTMEITGNNLETAVTGAISYVAGGKSKKMAILTGHSSQESDISAYEDLFKSDNFEVTVIDDQNLTAISNEYDVVTIIAPTMDFQKPELTALAEYLENGGKRDRSLFYFPTIGEEPLKNLNDFLLTEWGISMGGGQEILYETDDKNHYQQTPILLKSSLTEEHTDMGGGLNECWLALAVPVLEAKEKPSGVTTDILAQTSDTVVALPYEVLQDENWDGSTDSYTKQSYCAALRAEMMDYNDDNEEIKSQVFVFSSYISFLSSEFNEYYGLNSASNNILQACCELAVGGEVENVYFAPKSISSTEFTKPTESEAKAVRRVFMFVIPLLVIAAGVVVYIRRRNAR